MSIKASDLTAPAGEKPDGPFFTQEQAEAIARQVERGTDPEHDQVANSLELIDLGVPTAVALTLSDQIADLRVIEFNGVRGKPDELTAVGVNADVAKRFADAINAVNPEKVVAT